MVSLQELISRGRFVFSGAPRTFETFKLVDGKRSAKDIARGSGRRITSVLRDLARLRDFELLRRKEDASGNATTKDGSMVLEKTPMAKHIQDSFFETVADTKRLSKKTGPRRTKTSSQMHVHIPNAREILEICKNGEDQLYEFKFPGTDMRKISKEVAAFLNTRNGGIVFYGVDDDGSVIGSDLKRQRFDQGIQNSVRNTIVPPPTIDVRERIVMGSAIILVVVPPWDRKTLYQYSDQRLYIRKGTNVFALKPDEIQRLSKGNHVV